MGLILIIKRKETDVLDKITKKKGEKDKPDIGGETGFSVALGIGIPVDKQS